MRWIVLVVCIVMLFLVAEVSLIYGKKPPKPDDPPDDPPTGQIVPWGVDRIDADKVWSTNTGAGIRVAVLDTGISSPNNPHEDLQIAGWVDFTGTGEDDTHGHGTRIAGIIGALNNDKGVVGVAPGVVLYSVKFREKMEFLPEDYDPKIIGSGRRPYLYDAMRWCIYGPDGFSNSGDEAQVINMSFGIWTAMRDENGNLIDGEGNIIPVDEEGNPLDGYKAIKDKPLHDREFYELIQLAHDNGIAVTAASGNDDGRVINNYDSPSPNNYVDINKEHMFPASYDEVIAVSATRKVGNRDYFAEFSNVGPAVNITAPGQGIETTDNGGGYTDGSTTGGTSYSCPHVAGVAALILRYDPLLTPHEVLTRLTTTAEPLRKLTPDQQGAGMVDAEAAVNSSGAPPRYRVSPESKLTVTWGKLKRQ